MQIRIKMGKSISNRKGKYRGKLVCHEDWVDEQLIHNERFC